MDNSSLTGESEPQKRTEEDEPDQSRAIEAKNLAFFTTQVPVGTAMGIVIRIGDQTVIGKIQTLVTGTKAERKIVHYAVSAISCLAEFAGRHHPLCSPASSSGTTCLLPYNRLSVF